MSDYALLVECDPGTTLGGSCLRDVQNMATHLISRCQYKPDNIIITTTFCLSEDKKIKNVIYQQSKSFFNLFDEILEKNPKKILVLLSGHGFSVKDHNGDEKDGQDEAIRIERIIIDDEIRNNIVQKAKQQNIKLILLSDTCHSGTMFDLSDNNNILYDAFSISACSDNQLSMCDVGETTGFGGSLTTAILNLPTALEDINNFTPEKAYKNISNQLQKLNQKVIFSSEKW